MDSETGESIRDKETGEMSAAAKVNIETGECEPSSSIPQKQNRSKFRVPNNNPKPKPKSQLQLKTNSLVASDDVQSFNYPSDIAPVILFLLPTTLFFYPVIAMCLSFIETVLHVWAHKKNKKMSNKGFTYQSPLHLFVREFCAACREERSANKITRIQDKRNYRFIKYSIDYVQGIAI